MCNSYLYTLTNKKLHINAEHAYAQINSHSNHACDRLHMLADAGWLGPPAVAAAAPRGRGDNRAGLAAAEAAVRAAQERALAAVRAAAAGGGYALPVPEVFLSKRLYKTNYMTLELLMGPVAELEVGRGNLVMHLVKASAVCGTPIWIWRYWVWEHLVADTKQVH